jgi:hypothetical protein
MESARVSLVAMQLLLLIMRHLPGRKNFCANVKPRPMSLSGTRTTSIRPHLLPLPLPVAGDNADTTSLFKYQTGTCALEYWEPLKLLGEGSISDSSGPKTS